MSKKVLTIDDSKTLRMIVAKHLRPFDVEVVEAENGQDGVTMAQKEKPDLILLDYNMPVMDGYHTLVEMKADLALKTIPVIMLTTETVKETVLKLIKLGLKDYIAKPFTRECLLQKVNPLLGLYPGESPPTEAELAKAEPEAQSTFDSTKMSVLLVDDKENVLRILKEHLGQQFNVEVASNGLAAIKRFTNSNFDWLVLDLNLPDMSALNVYEAFRETTRKSTRPKRVIGMALRTAYKEILEAKSKGIPEFLLKPFTKQDVVKLAESAAQNHPHRSGFEEDGFLARNGDIRILSCPEASNPAFTEFVQALTSEILKEISEMADEGLEKLVIKLTHGITSSFPVAKRFINMMNQVQNLGLNLRLVADTEKVRNWLTHYSETRDLPIFDSVPSAIESFEHAPAQAAGA